MKQTRTESAPTMRNGFITELDEAGCRVRVKFPDLDGLQSYWLPWLRSKTHKDKFYSMPDVGEHVACLMDGTGEDGVVLGSMFSERDTAQGGGADQNKVLFSDGTKVEFDRASGKLLIHCTGDVEIISNSHIIMRAPRIDFNP